MTPLERLAQVLADAERASSSAEPNPIELITLDLAFSSKVLAALLDVVRAADNFLIGDGHDGYDEPRAKLDALIQERFPELPEPVPPS